MSTKELIQAELDTLSDEDLDGAVHRHPTFHPVQTTRCSGSIGS